MVQNHDAVSVLNRWDFFVYVYYAIILDGKARHQLMALTFNCFYTILGIV
jgi:hypothetical protein